MKRVPYLSPNERRLELERIEAFIRTQGIKVLPSEHDVASGLTGIPFFLDITKDSHGRVNWHRKPHRPEVPTRYIKLRFEP